MADGLPAQSALAHRRLAADAVAETRDAGVWLAELPHRLCLNLRGMATPEVRTILAQTAGCGLPVQPLESARRGSLAALWLAPDEWLLVGGSDDLGARIETAFRGHFITVTDVSDAYCALRLAGPHALDVLAKGCGLDTHDSVFPPGRVARSLLAKVDVILHRTAADAFEIFVARSYADYLWRWLEDAGREYGLAVVETDISNIDRHATA
jgi:sarcosine oxidase subunit gamma